MRVNPISKPDFLELAYRGTEEFLKRIDAPEAFAVKAFFPRREILDLRRGVFEAGLASEPSWHPLHDGCPDYHRLHDNYPNAYVKQKMHAFYFHGWYPHNRAKFDYFREIFALKNFLAGLGEEAFLRHLPSNGYVARVNVHHYPRGGGCQAEHVDPVGPHARIQTLVAASQIGEDYAQGGVYCRAAPGGERVALDGSLSPGDLLVMSPGIPHGVAPIDPDLPYEWRANDGRWMILPIIVSSDYPGTGTGKPRQLARGAQDPRP